MAALLALVAAATAERVGETAADDAAKMAVPYNLAMHSY